MATILFPRKGDRLRAHSVFFQAARVAASGYGVISGMVPSRSSAAAIAVASGSYRKGTDGVPVAYAGGSLTSVPAAGSGKHRYDLVVFDCSDSTLKRVEGVEDTPTLSTDFLENLQPIPPELANAQQILLGCFIVTSSGIQNQAHGHYCTAGVANLIIEVPNPVAGPASATDGNLLAADGATGKKAKDSGLSMANASDAIAKKHSNSLDHSNALDHARNYDTYLDYGGANQCYAVDVKDALNKKHSQNSDTYVGGISASQLSARAVEIQIGNGITPIEQGWVGRVRLPYNFHATGYEIIADQSGSITTLVRYSNFDWYPGYGDWFWANISGAQKNSGGLSNDWGAGTYFLFWVDSCSLITQVTISIQGHCYG